MRPAALGLNWLLFAALVLLPWAGGLWPAASGWGFELARPVGGFLIYFLITGLPLFRQAHPHSPERFAARALAACERNPRRALLLGSLIVGLLWTWISWQRHLSFGTNAYDLGIFENALWNWREGRGMRTDLKAGMHLLQDHQSWILWIIAPLYALLPSALTLFALQSFAVALAAIPLSALVRRLAPDQPRAALFAALILWCSGALRASLRFDFHPEVLVLPLTLGALALWASQRRMLGALFFLLALACKETAPLLLAALASAFLIRPIASLGLSRASLSLALMLSIAVFYFDTITVPRFFGAEMQHGYVSLYSALGSSWREVLLAPLQRPEAFAAIALRAENFSFLAALIAGACFVPLLAWPWIAFSLLVFTPLFLAGGTRVNPAFHYNVEPLTFFFAVWGLGLGKLPARVGPRLSLLALALAMGPSDFFYARLHAPDARLRTQLQDIAPDAPLAATSALIPHLSRRTHVQMLPERSLAQCVLWENAHSRWPLGPGELEALPAALEKEGYRLAFSCGGIELWEKPGADCWRGERSSCD